jgi:hypothetical protein
MNCATLILRRSELIVSNDVKSSPLPAIRAGPGPGCVTAVPLRSRPDTLF